MSLTVGTHLDSVTFLVGGTFGSRVDQAAEVWGPTDIITRAVWPGLAGLNLALSVGWPGGFPVESLFGDFEQRKECLDNLRRDVRAVRRLTSRVAIVAHSHGAWAAMRMAREMVEASGWRSHAIRLVTVAAPPLREQRACADKLAKAVRAGRLTWIGIAEDSDPVVAGWSAVPEYLSSPAYPAFGGETAFLRIDLGLSGFAAHDDTARRWETWSHVAAAIRASEASHGN